MLLSLKCSSDAVSMVVTVLDLPLDGPKSIIVMSFAG